MEQDKLKHQIDDFLLLKQENQKLRELVSLLIKRDVEDRSRWREAGISLQDVREIMVDYADPVDGITTSKVVERLQDLAQHALERRLKEMSREQ